MSKFKFVLVLVSITQAIKATTPENVMLKFLKSLLLPATPTFTIEETIEWNRMISEAVKAQHESFATQEELDWQLLLVEAQLGQAVSLVTATSTIKPVYFQDSWGGWWMTCNANLENAEAFGPRGCAVRCVPPALVRVEDEAEWEVYEEMDMTSDSASDNDLNLFETCTVCNNDKFTNGKVFEGPFICGGCQEETRYHLGLMKTEKEWEKKQIEEFLPF